MGFAEAARMIKVTADEAFIVVIMRKNGNIYEIVMGEEAVMQEYYQEGGQ